MFRVYYMNREVKRFPSRDQAVSYVTRALKTPDTGLREDDFEILDDSDYLSQAPR